MKRCSFAIALCCGALALLSVLALAAELPPQMSASPEALADGYLRDAAAHVPLTPEETAAMRPILVEQTRKRQELARSRLAANPGMAGMVGLRGDMLRLSEETDARLATVLSPEKLVAFKAYREERRRQAGRRRAAAQARPIQGEGSF